MFLKKLSLFNFKNHVSVELGPDASFNAFVGNNGEGKTNLLDAIHYLALCKSYFNPTDSQNIRVGEDTTMLQGTFELDGRQEVITVGLKRQQRKVVRRNGDEYDRLADHIGFIPLVMIAPTDTQLITEGSEERRRFLDSIISQYDKSYLEDLISYNRVLSQRNALLKQSSYGAFDPGMMEIFNDQLIPLGERIHQLRVTFLQALAPVFRSYYTFISGGKEVTDIQYDSGLIENDFTDLLKQSIERDRAAQFTTKGIHKDDLEFLIDGRPVKRFASQGQQKSFLVALKLAQFDFMRDCMKVKPLLLLDDIFDKLDDLRVGRLMELVSDDHFGQLFITDTHPARIREVFQRIGRDIRCFLVESGEVQPILSPLLEDNQHA
jgi:DNA replication and repair protein RecF